MGRELIGRGCGGRGGHGGCGRRAAFAAAFAVTWLSVLGSAAIAGAAEAPRWKVIVTTQPTNVVAGTPRNEVQKVTVNATGGTFTLSVEGRSTQVLPYNATATQVQTAVEEVTTAGDVTVSGGPAGSAPLEVVFQGEFAAKPIEMTANGSRLTGANAGVSLDELTRGAAAPQLIVTAINVGGASTDGSAIALGDTLGPGLVTTKVTGYDTYASSLAFNGEGGAAMTCASPPAVNCTYSGAVDPGDQLVMTATLQTTSTLGAVTPNTATVSGGGAAEEASQTPIAAGTTPAGFGPAPESVLAAVSTTQAGAHPNLTTTFTLDTSETYAVSADTKDIRFDLPPGLVGNTVGLPRCSMSRVVEEAANPTACPSDTMVGMATLSLSEGAGTYDQTLVVPVYNIAPSPGEPAAFAFDALILPVRLDTSVLSDGNYGVRVTAPSLPEVAQTLATSITVWGVPAEHSGPGKDISLYNLVGGGSFGGPNPGQTPVPLLTNPQQCKEPLVATMSTDPWVEQGVFRSEQASMGTLTGCGLVPFGSSFTFLPDTFEAGAPAGYVFDLNIPQRNERGVLATSSLKNFKLMLPEGVVVNPSTAWGLKACSNAQFYGPGHPSQEPAAPEQCPREAQVGEVEVETPDLEHPLKGQVFLGTPECEPCSPADAEGGRMVRLLVQLVGEGEAGVVVKLEGHALIDQRTGRITTVFDGTPQVPFNRLHFVLDGGPRAVLVNPRTCGPVRAAGALTPWSSDLGGGEEVLVNDSTPSYEFEIKQGCFGPQFQPSFKAGSPDIQAGEYSPFTLAFGRSDADQFLGVISQMLPPGLLGNIASVPLCKEPQASEGTCGSSSLIGHVQALTGPGADPFLVTGGTVALTEGYGGAPYGLSIVVPAVAGPYTLSGSTGKGTVVVRAKIEIDPTTAALTVTSDPLPSMLDGIPLQLKAVSVTIDRPNFTFNPTNCSKLSIGAMLTSTEGMSATVASPFQVTNCATLGFKPAFSVSTNGKTSRANGASLHVKLSYPRARFGSQANIKSVKVDLPKQLPSELKTLQKACPDSVFDANPAGCDAESRIGSATATTPVLPVALTGPVYFVSHAGLKFPELVIVLSGYGTTVQLHAETFISKTGITSSTFRTIPDVPVDTFELTLPQGKYSALAAPAGKLCTTVLKMPTAFTAQNGATIKQSTPITVTGCPKHKTKKKTKKGAHRRHRRT
jgi:hypothetical protein